MSETSILKAIDRMNAVSLKSSRWWKQLNQTKPEILKSIYILTLDTV